MKNIQKKKICSLEGTLFELLVLAKIEKEAFRIGIFMPIF